MSEKSFVDEVETHPTMDSKISKIASEYHINSYAQPTKNVTNTAKMHCIELDKKTNVNKAAIQNQSDAQEKKINSITASDNKIDSHEKLRSNRTASENTDCMTNLNINQAEVNILTIDAEDHSQTREIRQQKKPENNNKTLIENQSRVDITYH